jgi:hypothetical protein
MATRSKNAVPKPAQDEPNEVKPAAVPDEDIYDEDDEEDAPAVVPENSIVIQALNARGFKDVNIEEKVTILSDIIRELSLEVQQNVDVTKHISIVTLQLDKNTSKQRDIVVILNKNLLLTYYKTKPINGKKKSYRGWSDKVARQLFDHVRADHPTLFNHYVEKFYPDVLYRAPHLVMGMGLENLNI